LDKIFLKGMEFYGYHGVYPAERELGQRYLVDLECHLDLKQAGLTDDLEKTVNYAEVYQLIHRIMEKDPPKKLLETLAEQICQHLFREFPLVQTIQCRVIKPDPPIPGHYKHVGVEIVRSRDHVME
jgi:dihydroneopterin aldolase